MTQEIVVVVSVKTVWTDKTEGHGIRSSIVVIL